MATTWLATHDVVTEYFDLFDDESKFCNVLPFLPLKFTKFVRQPGTFKKVYRNSCNISHTLTTRADEFSVVVVIKDLQFFVDLPHVISE